MQPAAFLKPDYQNGFASLPGKIIRALGSHTYDAVILLLVDGFGWRFLEQFQQTPFLRRAAVEGHIEKITSQFPSTTAAHITTIHTGLPVGAHGVLEWNYYEPSLDMVITPLLFSRAGEYLRDTLLAHGAKPRKLLPKNEFYPPLKKQGFAATLFQHREYTPSTYSDVVFNGAAMSAFKTLPEALVNLGLKLAGSTTPQYLYLYFDKVDALSHEYGPTSPQVGAEILVMLAVLEQVLLPTLQASKKHILLLLTADHGQVETDPNTTVYINREARFAGMEKFLRTDRSGAPLVAAGSARDFFLYIHPQALEEAQAFLAERLAGTAEVRRVADMVEQGFFGRTISQKFLQRAGDLVILPFAGETVWWYEKERFEMRFRGHHGGLTPQELEIPLLTWEM